jgi:hypothetical protein
VNNKCYEFVIQNSEGNGLDGGYLIWVEGEVVYDEDADFRYSDTVSLCLDDRGNFVEPQSECDDDPTFLWKGKANKNCDWVAKKLNNKPKLCNKRAYRGESEKIRDYCQQTCNRC